jgi:hypothetical protein
MRASNETTYRNFRELGGPIPTLGNAMEEETTEENRLPTKWTKGMASPNPAGRPKMPKTAKEVRDIARLHTPAAIETLARVMKNPKSPAPARVAAAAAILDRGWGKPSGDLENAEGLIIQVVKFTQIEEPEIKMVEGTIIDNEGGDRDN